MNLSSILISEPMHLEKGAQVGPYVIVSVLGTGGMGEVYRARDNRLGRDVALKVLKNKEGDGGSEERLKREARAIASLSHSNILSIYDFGTSGEITYAVMELLEGSTLRQRLERGVVPLQECLGYAVQICRGLQAAHDKSILHRDLKPENLFLLPEGHVKILDFGMARTYSGQAVPGQNSLETVYKTEKGVILGTFPYMSPEQATMKEVDSRSDLFSLGVVLYEITTGRSPFLADNFASVIASIIKDNPAPADEVNPTLPQEWARILRRLLQKDPELRYSSANELRADLEALQKGNDIAESAPRSIAVLPFSDMSPSKDQDYFCEGMSEEIINALAKIRGLKVSARISSFQFKHQPSIDIREIGKRLGVATVLEGSVRKSGERLRITAQLINVADGYHLWSESFNRELRDVFEIQEEIAQSIVSALAVTLQPAQQMALKKQRANPQAYEFFLRGKTFLNQESKKGLEYAVEMMQRAIASDPEYAPAYAGLCDILCRLFQFWGARQSNLAQAEEASRRALDLAPDLAETHLSRGHVLSLMKRFDEALAEFNIVLHQDPGSFEGHYLAARVLWSMGKMEESAAHYERAAEIRPEDFRVRGLLVSVYRELKKPDLVHLWSLRTLEALQPWVELHPDDSRAMYFAAGVNAELGNRARAIEWANKSIAVDPEDPAIYYNVACMYGTLKEIDNSLDMLETAIDKGFSSRSWIENDGDLASVRDHPRFKTVLDKIAVSDSNGM